jgi:hypothetical protein
MPVLTASSQDARADGIIDVVAVAADVRAGVGCTR